MAKLLGSLISSFLLLRDLFGYLIPGALFTAMMLASFRLGDKVAKLLPPISEWLWLAIFLVVSYAVGQILVALGFAAHDTLWPGQSSTAAKVDEDDKDGKNGKNAQNARTGNDAKKTGGKPGPGDNAEYLFYRHLYPQLFIDADRREIVAFLRAGLAMALLLGPAVALLLALSGLRLEQPVWMYLGLAVAGAFMLYNSCGAQVSLKKFRADSVTAAKLVERKGVKPFAWSPATAGED